MSDISPIFDIISEAIRKEYFNLMKDLNVSNKLRNEKTELSFAVEKLTENDWNVFALLSNDQKYLVSSYSEQRGWVANTNSVYDNLCSFVTYLLRTGKVETEKTDLTTEIKNFVFRKPN